MHGVLNFLQDFYFNSIKIVCMNKKSISWALYDWANSVFFTTVMAGFFPIFFKQYWNTDTAVNLSTQRLSTVLGISGFCLALVAPFLGALSDYRKVKKNFLFIFMLMGVTANAFLFLVPQGDWFFAACLYGLAFFCCSASCIFNDAMLVSVAEPKDYDKISSLGYSLGYLGGGVLFTINVLMYQKPEWFGFQSGVEGVKYSFLTVSIWWFLFSLPTLINVPEPEAKPSSENLLQIFRKTISELKKTVKELFKQKNIFYFIVAYWFYIDGVSTIMSMAVDFGISIGFEAGDLIKALLLTQFVGFPAAYLTGYLASRFGTKVIINLCLLVYVFVVIGASYMKTSADFYIMATLIGLSQGGVQALSRSLFASLIPIEKSGEYFGFFNLLGKFAAVLGPFLVAFASIVFEQPQKTFLSLLILFGFGIYFLNKVKVVRT